MRAKRHCWVLMALTAASVLIHASAALSVEAEELDPPAYVYLTWARDDTARSINVSWRTMEQGYLGEVLYDIEPRGRDAELYRYRAAGDPAATPVAYEGLRGYVHHVELTGLEPDTIYYFIAGHSSYGWSEERAFRTGPAERASFRFVEGSDSQRLPPDWPKDRDALSRLMARYNPSFVLFPGDLVEIWDDQWEWDNWFAAVGMYWVSEDGLTIPIIPAIGNHDVKSSGDYDPMKDAPSYYGRFNLPGNEQWYALSWGPDLRIIVLDSEVMGGAAWRKQLDWLEGELSASSDYLWKIAILHRDMVSSTGLDQRMINDLAFLFDKYHVDLVMMGHRHVYERSYPLNWTKSSEEPMKSPEEGTIYIVGGAWGGGLSSPGRPKWFSAFEPASEYSFVLVDVFENGTLHLKAMNIENNIFDELILRKEVPEVAEVPIAVISVFIAAAAIGILYLLKRGGLRGSSIKTSNVIYSIFGNSHRGRIFGEM